MRFSLGSLVRWAWASPEDRPSITVVKTAEIPTAPQGEAVKDALADLNALEVALQRLNESAAAVSEAWGTIPPGASRLEVALGLSRVDDALAACEAEVEQATPRVPRRTLDMMRAAIAVERVRLQALARGMTAGAGAVRA